MVRGFIISNVILFVSLFSTVSLAKNTFYFNPEWAEVSLMYNDGTGVYLRTDRDDVGLTKLESSLDHYINTGEHCFMGNVHPICKIRFYHTIKNPSGNVIKHSNFHWLNYDNLSAVAISQHPKMNRCRDTTAVISMKGRDSTLSMGSSYEGNFTFLAGFTESVNNADVGFSPFMHAWSDYMKSGNPQRIKWKFKSHCHDTYTTVYIFDFGDIRSVTHRGYARAKK